MKNGLIRLLLIVVCLPSVSLAQVPSIDEDLSNQGKYISLKDAIEQGLRKNNGQKVRVYQDEKLEIEWKDNKTKFLYPKLYLGLSTEQNTIDNLYKDVNTTANSTKNPDGTLTFGFEDYTLFNWGRDYLEYQNNKNTYKRGKQALSEKQRELRLMIIQSYFKLSKEMQILKVKKNQLRQTSFVHKLAKQKMNIRKIKLQEFLQAKSEFLRAHSEYQSQLTSVSTAEMELASVIGDNIKANYRTTQQLDFKSFTGKKHESLATAYKNNSEYLNSQYLYQNANRSYQKALKDNMPLPKVDMKLGALKHKFSQSGASNTYETSTNSKDVELVASINMKWTIFGDGGIGNNRTNRKYFLEKKMAESNLKEARRDLQVKVHTYHKQIRYLEKQYLANEAQYKNSRTLYDRTLDNYLSGKTSFANLKLVLDLMINSYEQIEVTKYDHLTYKILLANVLGVEDFPGESFERLVMK